MILQRIRHASSMRNRYSAAATVNSAGLARRTAAIIIIASVLALPALAQVQAPSDYMQRMDRDGDGRVSLAEYIEWMSYGFDAMDKNGNGILEPHEQPGGRGKPITRSEHIATLTERFRRQDSDKDGYLSAKELAAPPR